MISADKLAQAFAIGAAPATDEYRFATVVSTEAGVYVQLSNTKSQTRCTDLVGVDAGDRVQVCIKANGSCVIIGKIGKAVTYPDYYKPYEEPGGYYELYSNASGTDGTVPLNDAAENYQMLEISYAKSDYEAKRFTHKVTRKSDTSDYSDGTSLPLFQLAGSGGRVAQFAFKGIAISGANIMQGNVPYVNANVDNGQLSGGWGTVNTSFKIYKVIGYK